MGVDIHSAVAEEADQGLVVFLGVFHRKTGGRGNGGDYGEVGGECFLYDFVGDPAANQEDALAIVGVSKETFADDLVEGVVPSDIFPKEKKVSQEIEPCAGVKAPGLGEGFLGSVQTCGQAVKRFRRNAAEGLNDGFGRALRGEGGFGTQAATRRGDKEAADFGQIQIEVGGGSDIEDGSPPSGWEMGAGGNLKDVFAFGDQPFGEEKSGDKLPVVAGSAHQGDEGLVVNPDFQGFLDRDPIGGEFRRAV